MENYFYPLEAGREAWNSSITPKWTITEQKSASGRRRAVCEQAFPTWIFKLSYKALTDEEANTLQGFYCLRKGAFEPFYYKDYANHKQTAQTLAINADGTYQCVANIGGYVEPVSYVDNLVVYVNGKKTTNYTVSNGKISISTSGTVTADYDYYLKVHFTGELTITQIFEGLNTASVALEVVR